MKYLAITMTLATLTFLALDKSGAIGDAYAIRSGVLHAIFLTFGWIGYQLEAVKEGR